MIQNFASARRRNSNRCRWSAPPPLPPPDRAPVRAYRIPRINAGNATFPRARVRRARPFPGRSTSRPRCPGDSRSSSRWREVVRQQQIQRQVSGTFLLPQPVPAQRMRHPFAVRTPPPAPLRARATRQHRERAESRTCLRSTRPTSRDEESSIGMISETKLLVGK